MEAVFAIEITAIIVVAPSGARSLGLAPEMSGWMVNSYLYSVFISMAVFYAFRRFIVKHIPAAACFYFGIILFIIGNLMCWGGYSAASFFTGRVIQGIGGALAMTGDLWAACEYYHEKITIPLFWAECGCAIGVIIGPTIGGFIASGGEESWRLLFLVNASIGIVTALGAWSALRGKKSTQSSGLNREFRIPGWFVRLVLVQCAVAALAVGAEFLMSDYTQVRLGESPRIVGLLLVVASIGTILGSKWMAGYDRSFVKSAQIALVVLVVAHIMLAGTLFLNSMLMSVLPIFVIGTCIGIANVAIYAEIAKKMEPVFFLPATILYLIAMQIGYSMGVETISLTESRAWSLAGTETMMVIVALVPLLLLLGWMKFKKTA